MHNNAVPDNEYKDGRLFYSLQKTIKSAKSSMSATTKHLTRALNTLTRRIPTMTIANPTLNGVRAMQSSPSSSADATTSPPPKPAPLSDAQISIIKSTAPILAQHGTTITSHFYKRMLTAHPELHNIFNTAHQATGTQPAALAHAVWAYAANIDNLPALSAAVSRIAHKHASLGVTPDQYPIVGEHLLASLVEVLGSEAVTPDVVDAWGAAYGVLADIFVGVEKGLYEEAKQREGGWNGWRGFKVVRKVKESEEIVSIYLEPVDGKSLPVWKAGQYVSVRVWVEDQGVWQPRQYSLSEVGDGTFLRISVKREMGMGKPDGKISNLLHEKVPEGMVVDVSMPYGDFTLDGEEKDAKNPVVLISGGVGITPMLSMLGTLTAPENAQRQVTFVHATRNGKVHAMKEYLSRVVAANPEQVSKAVFYEEVDPEADQEGQDFDFTGRIDLQKVKEKVLLDSASYYVCGPLPFMKAQRQALNDLGVENDRIHMEVFGSGII